MASIFHADLGTLFIVLAVIAFALMIWRATLRDVLGTILLGAAGVVLLLVAT